jgi:regulation of enolase protein 1 (concanavalin A-like superfamily)
MLRTAIVFVVLAGCSLARGEGPRATEKVVFHDPFYAKLAAGWTWVREAPSSAAFAVVGAAMGKAWRVFKNSLVMRVLPGYLHAHTNNSSNILLRPLPDIADQPYAFEVALGSNPKVPYEHAGLVWYVDDDNYVGLFREFLGTKPQVLMVTEKRAHPTFHYGGVYQDETIWLRLEVAHGKITGKFRGDPEEDWQTVGTSSLPIPSKKSKPRVGLHTGGAPDRAGRFVRFWDFRILTFSNQKAKPKEKTRDEKAKTTKKPK